MLVGKSESYVFQILNPCTIGPLQGNDHHGNSKTNNIKVDSTTTDFTEKVKLFTIPTLDLFPNPASNTLIVRLQNVEINKLAKIFIYNSIGQKCRGFVSGNDITQIDIGGLSNSIYYLVYQYNQTSITKTFVVSKNND